MDNLFGLGISISLQDLASNGLKALSSIFDQTKQSGQNMTDSIDQSFQRLQNFSINGAVMSQFGQQIYQTGMNGINTLKQLGQQIIDTGSQYETMRQTMSALYNSATIGAQKTQWAMNMAAKTPFQMTDLTQMMIRMKSIGVEADKMYTNQKGQAQSLAQYIGDLASLHPEKGLQMTTQEIQELLEMSPRGTMAMRSLGVSIETLEKAGAGSKWGSTTEERIQQLVKVSSYMANGLSSKLMTTWQGITSNIEDQFTRIKLAISDSGAFDAVKNTLLKFSNFIGGIDDTKLKKLGQSIAGAFTMIWKPIDFVVTALINFGKVIVNLAENNPFLAKLVVGLVAVASAGLVATGMFFKLAGGAMMAIGTFGTFLLMLQQAGGMSSILSGLSGSMGVLVKSMLPIAITAGLMYLAYRTNFMGIRDIMQNFVNNSFKAFNYSGQVAQMGAKQMSDAVDSLNKKDDFFSKLTLGLIKIQVLFQAVADAWSDNTLSTDNFQKANKLGLLPIIESILKMKVRAEEFFKGFTKGSEEAKKDVEDFYAVIKPALMFIMDKLVGVTNNGDKVTTSVDGIKKAVSGVDTKKWQDFGEKVARLGEIFVVWKISNTVAGIAVAVVDLGSKVVSFGVDVGKLVLKYGELAIARGKQVVEMGVEAGIYVKDAIVKGASIVKTLALAGAQKVVTAAQWAWNIAMNANPIALIIIGLVALGVAIYEIATHWDTVKKKTKEVIDAILGFIKPFTDVVGKVVSALGSLFGFNGKKVSVGVQTSTTNSQVSGGGKMLGLSTGGYVETTGIAVLHPDEVVVNDETTQQLKTFLASQKSKAGSFNSVSSSSANVDQSVTIEKGAIVVQSSGDTDKDIDSIIDKIEARLKRRKQINNMVAYKPI